MTLCHDEPWRCGLGTTLTLEKKADSNIVTFRPENWRCDPSGSWLNSTKCLQRSKYKITHQDNIMNRWLFSFKVYKLKCKNAKCKKSFLNTVTFLVLVILDARTHCLPRNVRDHYQFRQTGVLDRCTRQVYWTGVIVQLTDDLQTNNIYTT